MNNAATWWKVGVPLLTIFVLAITNFHGANFTAAGGFMPVRRARRDGRGLDLRHHLRAARLRAGDPARRREREPQAGHPARDHRLDPDRRRDLHPAAGRLHRRAAGRSTFAAGWAHLDYKNISGPFAGLATLVGLGWLAAILYIDAIISPGGTGLIYTTSTSRITYGLSRNGYVPVQFEQTDAARCAVARHAHRVRRRLYLLPAVPELAAAGLVHHLGQCADVRRRAAGASGCSGTGCRTASVPYRLPGGEVLAPFAFVVANLIILWSGWDTDWRLGVAISSATCCSRSPACCT